VMGSILSQGLDVARVRRLMNGRSDVLDQARKVFDVDRPNPHETASRAENLALGRDSQDASATGAPPADRRIGGGKGGAHPWHGRGSTPNETSIPLATRWVSMPPPRDCRPAAASLRPTQGTLVRVALLSARPP
jgi:hypothetical protein